MPGRRLSPPESPKPPSDQPRFRNQILAHLRVDEARELRPHLTRARLVRGQILMEPGEQAQQVWFVEEGFVSMVAQFERDKLGVEVGLIGREGMVGTMALFGAHRLTFNCAMVQMPGEARRMPLEVLKRHVDHLPALRRRLLHAFSLEIAQISQSAACNGRHSILHRCAKWLLMAHERMDGDELPLTQEFLSVTLAVRRPSVTMALNRLHRDGLIRSHRGVITIVDLPGLKRVACECYVRLKEFDQRLSALGKSGT